MTLSILIPATLTTVMGLIMMLPQMRRQAQERGLSGDIIIPGIITMTGAVLYLIGVYVV